MCLGSARISVPQLPGCRRGTTVTGSISAADDLDVTRARALLARGPVTRSRDPVRAFALLREAHALWRGPMLADLTDVAPIATAVEGYERLHRDVTDAMIASAIDARQADAVLGLATRPLAADPLREPAVLLLMRALAATAQAPEALRTAREYRHLLAEETGLDPSPALGELERDIASGAAVRQRHRHRRRPTGIGSADAGTGTRRRHRARIS